MQEKVLHKEKDGYEASEDGTTATDDDSECDTLTDESSVNLDWDYYDTNNNNASLDLNADGSWTNKFDADIYERVSDYEDEEFKGYEGSYEDGHENVAKTDVSVEGFEPI